MEEGGDEAADEEQTKAVRHQSVRLLLDAGERLRLPQVSQRKCSCAPHPPPTTYTHNTMSRKPLPRPSSSFTASLPPGACVSTMPRAAWTSCS